MLDMPMRDRGKRLVTHVRHDVRVNLRDLDVDFERPVNVDL